MEKGIEIEEIKEIEIKLIKQKYQNNQEIIQLGN